MLFKCTALAHIISESSFKLFTPHVVMDYWQTNIDGLVNKSTEILNMLEGLNPDILLFSETHLGEADSLDLKTSRKTYKHNCHIHSKKRAELQLPPIHGLSIYTDLDKGKAVFEIPSDKHEIIQLDLIDHYNDKIRLLHTYLSPSSRKNSVDEFFHELHKCIVSCPRDRKVIITGDMNAKHNDIHHTTSPNYAGKVLNDFLNGKLVHEGTTLHHGRRLHMKVKKP